MELIELIQEITGNTEYKSYTEYEQEAIRIIKAQRKELEELRGIAEHYEPFRIRDEKDWSDVYDETQAFNED